MQKTKRKKENILYADPSEQEHSDKRSFLSVTEMSESLLSMDPSEDRVQQHTLILTDTSQSSALSLSCYDKHLHLGAFASL